MEEIFQGTKKFKQEVFDQVQIVLNKFGLYIYNANVKQLVDEPGHEYFSYLGQKTQKEAQNKAKVDVAEEQMKGEVGTKERQGLTRQNAAKVGAETKVLSVRQEGIALKEEAKVRSEVQVYDNEREAEIAAAQAGLAMKKAGWEKQSKVAQVEAVKAVAIREAELQMEVERKNALRLTEKLKAEQLSKATVQYETQKMARFIIASPSEYLAITGWGVDDVKLARKAWVWVGQRCKKFDISPVNYEFDVQAMSAEKLAFKLPAVFAIGPKILPTHGDMEAGDVLQSKLSSENQEALLLYAKLIAPLDRSSNHVIDLVKGVIEGETRVLAASMTMEQIFQGTKNFKDRMFEQVQLDLNKFGLYIYNANVKQLVDEPGHEYFSYLGQKTQQEAVNQAKVDVAEACMKGQMGSKEREGLTRQNAAKVNAETKCGRRVSAGLKEESKVKAEVKVYENEREAEIAAAQAGLTMKKAGWEKQSKVAQVEAVKAVAIREAELQVEVERKNALRLTEKLKAEQLTQANVQYETQVQDSNAALYKRQKAAEATLYEEVKLAEARKAQADAMFFEQKLAEDARLYAKEKEAEALNMVGKAKAEYVSSMLQALGGSYNALRDYLMIDGGMYQEMARINAGAVSGMQPKISIWSNGGGADGANAGAGEAGIGGAGAMQQVAGVYKMLPPLLSTVHEQTGMVPPAWMGSLPNDVPNCAKEYQMV
uniref:Flotillin-like n=1 Tax=Leersia perrieri TaxID=77586 RepID=A0A0D9XKR4_9ORYZ